jgi:multidrug efflux pump subunit AcrB
MTFIAMFAVPIVLAVTALLLYALNQSFNIMTLGGMAAAVGLIIDDAIVMSEHIVRRLRAGKTAEARATVLHATDEFTRPLAGSSLSTIVIHIPPAFMIGVAGAFFASLSLSMASSLIISFFVAWLAIPVLAAAWLSGRDAERSESGEFTRTVHSAYAATMRALLPHAWLVILILLPLLAIGFLAYRHVETGFLPKVDEGGFTIDYVAPAGTSVTETDRLCRQVEKILDQTPEVESHSRRTGYNFGAGELSESNTGDFFVRLKPFPRRGVEDVADEIEKKVAKKIPGFESFETAQLMEDLIGDLTGRPQPVVVNLYSDDQSVLNNLAPKVKTALEKISGVKDVKSGIIPAGDALVINVDRVKASLEGVDPDSLSKSISDLLDGDVVTQVEQGPKLIAVRVWIPLSDRKTTRDVADLQLRAPDGHFFPLKRVANLSVITGQPEITREDLKRRVSVTARSERDLGSTIRDVKEVLDKPGLLPPGLRYTLGGLYEQQQIAFRGLLGVIVAATALVFLLLLFLYESFRVAIAILLTTLLAMSTVLAWLWLTGTQLNVASIMGMVMIVGNVTEVAVFFYSEYVETSEISDRRECLIAAGTFRMRAIVMTSVAAILALLPLALGFGHGSGMLQPLAIAIVGGLIAQLPLVLLVFPAILVLFGALRIPSSEPPPP